LERNLHTFEKLLAGILLEECFMGDRTSKVINHELKDRVDLLLSVTRIVAEGGVL